MKYYNLYYLENKLNNRPITEEELKEINKKQQIYKRDLLTGKLKSIPTNKIQVVKTIII